MLLGISIKENEYKSMTKKQRLALLDDAVFRAKQMRLRAENYLERTELIKSENVLDQKQTAYVNALLEGLLD